VQDFIPLNLNQGGVQKKRRMLAAESKNIRKKNTKRSQEENACRRTDAGRKRSMAAENRGRERRKNTESVRKKEGR